MMCCHHSFAQKQPKKDTTKLAPADSARRPTFRLRDRYGDPFSNFTSYSPLFLKDPKSLNLDVQIDTGMNYNIYEKIGKINFRPTSSMSFKEFSLQQDRVNMKEYWKNRSQALDGESAVSGRNLLPKIYVSPLLDRIFGGSFVEIIPRGNVALDFGASFQTIKNPAIPIRQQSNGGFEFDQQINLSVTGKIGEKLKVATNFDNNNSFDFQNSMKIEYTGFKEDILRKLELGNVSLPLNNSLITGASNLFGVKAQMQFGKLSVTTVASTQRGKQTSIEIPGSTSGTSQGRQFEVIGSNYDDNRHFFLAQFFRDQFEGWLSTLPQITSGVNITRVEVYLLNRNNDTQTLRDVVGLMDMGESKRLYRKDAKDGQIPLANRDYIRPNFPASNEANNFFKKDAYLRRISAVSDEINAGLEGLGFVNGLDFEKITSARKLSATEFSYHKELGYITLQRKLQNDEALAVAFEYTYNGQAYKVGELTEDYSNKPDKEVVYLKLLRPRKVSVKDQFNKILPTWNLMMKNVYNLNLNQVAKEGFQLKIIYRDDATGKDNPQLQESGVAGTRQLISIAGLDKLNPYNDPLPNGDGNFDFVENVTINTTNGLVIFPFLEPFNKPFRDLFKTDPPNTDRLNNKYLYDTLYNTTKAEAELVATKNKFFIVGTSKSGSGKEISLQGFNVAQGSVKVFAGGTPLREGADYQVDYNLGKVTILNEGVLSSGKNISVTYEQQDPFAFQTRSLLGTRLDYKLSDDINIGSTLLYFNERPLISRNAIGTEPARNIQYGLDINLRKDSRLLTKMVDALPFLQTKEKSSITFNAEFAQLLPGTSNSINGDGTSFIDDFENTATPYSLINPASWKLSSVPSKEVRFDLTGGGSDDIRAGYRRAKLAWYQVDNLFYRTGGAFKPTNISEKDLENHYIRPVLPKEIFPGQDVALGNFFQPIFDVAYFPKERGPYNFNPDLNPDGTLKNPEKNWAGITTAIRTEVDFDKANVEYIEFWLMDPFINSANGRILDGNPNPQSNQSGGKLIFQLGSISEDLMRDGKHAFENGLPADGDLTKLGPPKAWGYVTSQQYLNNAFDNLSESRRNQDVGLDGIGNTKESDYFKDFINAVPSNSAKEIVRQDPSADDFRYFLGDDLDAKDAKVLERYKNINGLENNTPIPNAGDAFARSGTTIPDNEDLNQDNTLSDLEEYYSYNIDLLPAGPKKLDVGNRFVVDKIVNSVSGDPVTWYLFRIPIKQFDDQVGAINGFKSIRYARMLLTGFTQPVVLRMANFRTVGNRWRQYTSNLQEPGLTKPPEPNLDNFSISVVNVEENSKGNDIKPPYVPALARDRDNTSTIVRRLNEQSVQMCVKDLADGDARAIYKNVSMDFYNYGRIKMFVSANGSGLKDNELTAFMRFGTDFDQNYYEVEIPLKITPNGETVPDDEIWPEQNQFDIDLNDLYALKAKRDREGASLNSLYPLNGPQQSGKHGLRIFGRPDLSGVRLIMIGVRNPKSTDTKPLSVCIWANELRLTDFDRQAGWAANAVLNAKLADLGNITASIRHSTPGYGNVQSKISERTRAEATTFDISGTINIDKLLPPKLGLKIPMFASYESIIGNPNFDPANPDLRIKAALASFNTDDERSGYLKIIQDKTIRRSLNFTNVKKVKLDPKAKSHIYDVENFAFSYAYSSSEQTNFNLSENTRRGYKGSVSWQYSSSFKGIEPFKNAKWLSSPFLQLIKDFNFNPVPTSISVRGDLDRAFSKIVNRNSSTDALNSQPNFSKYFIFNRSYNVRWALTKSISLDYSSRVNAIIDEPDGDLDTQKKRDSVINNLKRFGRMKAFDQNITANYTLPLDKLPLTNWLGADYRHNVGYSWRAGPLEKIDSLKLGNIIQNTRDQAVNGKIDLIKLYNKVGFLKEINNPKPKPTAAELAKNKSSRPDTIKRPPELSGIKSLLRLIMTVRSVTGTYSVTSGTSLPGFMPSPYLVGNSKGWQAPGWDFILGGQDADIRFKAAENGWLSRSKKLTTPFTQNQTKDLSLRTSLEPFPDFKIQLDARKTSTSAFQEIFRDSTGNGDYRELSPSRTGSYKISMATFATTFANNSSLTSTVYEEFKNNIQVIKERFRNATNQGYEDQSQDVLIPAFIAAYSGKSAEKVSLSPFPNIPIPNWRLDYAGLSKIPALKEIFQTVSLNHAYNSSYSVLNFSNSLQYSDVPISNPVEDYNVRTFGGLRNSSGVLVPVYVIQNVIISEQFAPLIGINVLTKSKVSMKFEYKTKRDLSLNVSNAQITEMLGTDWSFDLGFTKNNMRLPFKENGRTITLKNDVTFKLTMSLQDTRTILRKLEGESAITNGNVNFQLRPNVSYIANKKLTVQGYFDYNTNEPLVSNSFPRATTRAGFKILYNLAQ
jgi:cell surface protein SprA